MRVMAAVVVVTGHGQRAQEESLSILRLKL